MYITARIDCLDYYAKAMKESGFSGMAKLFSDRDVGFFRKVDVINCDTSRSCCDQEFSDNRYQILDIVRNIAIEQKDLHCMNSIDRLELLGAFETKNRIKTLRGFRKELENFIKESFIHGWLFRIDQDNNIYPYLLSDISYKRAMPEYSQPAKITISLKYVGKRKSSGDSVHTTSISFENDKVFGRKVEDILASSNFYHENKFLMKRYRHNLKCYLDYVDCIGSMFTLSDPNAMRDLGGKIGDCIQVINNENPSMVREVGQYARSAVLNKKTNNLLFEEDEDLEKLFDDFSKDNTLMEQGECPIPIHPEISVYSLINHKEKEVMASTMMPYEFDKNVGDKLVLPDSHRDLIDILINDSDIVLEDIVANKSGGTIILCKGKAGLGKTLTAQVYSEKVGIPLFDVHAGVLGTDPSKIDDKLTKILGLAQKWGCITLLDEADLYIRARDNDMEHNTIVSAFLRQIEKYSGILFMTTNRDHDIDDAILSRCSAIIHYQSPNHDQSKRLWEVLSTNFGLTISDSVLDRILEIYPGLAGRDIKEILKLCTRFSHNSGNTDLSEEDIRKSSIFRGIFPKDKKENEH